jgi:hypothetical protein
MGIGIDDYDQSTPRPGLTAAVLGRFPHKLFPHPIFGAPPPRWGSPDRYRMPFQPALDEVPVDKHFVMLILYQGDD